MQISRKDFLKSSLILGGGFFLNGSKINSMSRFFQDATNLKVIRGNAGIYFGGGGTIGWYANEDGVLVIDTQFPKDAEIFHNDLKKKAQRKIDLLFNTHHHRDHTSGNYYFKDYVDTIIAQENCPKLQKERNTEKGKEELVVVANKTFKDQMTFELGKQKINAYHYYNAHTGGDAIYHLENENVVHMGDLVFNGFYPFIDIDGGASLTGWADYLNKVLNQFPDDTIFIYGHGNNAEESFGGKEPLKLMADYINKLYDFSSKEAKAGKTKDEFMTNTSIPGVTNRVEKWPGALKHNLEMGYRYVSEKNQ